MLNEKEKELMVRALTHYYKTHVWSTMREEDFSKGTNNADDEDTEIRKLAMKLEIDKMYPVEISSRL